MKKMIIVLVIVLFSMAVSYNVFAAPPFHNNNLSYGFVAYKGIIWPVIWLMGGGKFTLFLIQYLYP